MSNENYTPGEDDLQDDELDQTDKELNEIEEGYTADSALEDETGVEDEDSDEDLFNAEDKEDLED